MPKAKPISLHPLSFEDAIKTLLNVDPARVRIPSKPRKDSSKWKRRPKKESK